MSRTGGRVRVAVVLLVVTALAVGGVTWWRSTHRVGIRFSAEFGATVGLYPGSDVRMLGVRVGAVDSVHPHGDAVTVTMHLDRKYAAAAGTAAVILSPSLVSDRYVQLTQVWSAGPRLAAGTVIPLDRTATPVELDTLYASIDQLTTALGPDGANKSGALSDLLTTSAANLSGNGAALGQALHNLSGASSALASSKDDLFGTVANLQRFTAALAASDSSVGGFNTQLAAVSAVLAADRQSFSDALQQLTGALALVQTFVVDNRAALTSNVAKLTTITQTLTAEKASLEQALATAPSAVQNVLAAYDPTHQTLDGRGNLNELSIWATGSSSTATSSHTAGSGPTAAPPPLLLPTDGATTVGGGTP